jgi:hypothetical protein
MAIFDKAKQMFGSLPYFGGSVKLLADGVEFLTLTDDVLTIVKDGLELVLAGLRTNPRLGGKVSKTSCRFFS